MFGWGTHAVNVWVQKVDCGKVKLGVHEVSKFDGPGLELKLAGIKKASMSVSEVVAQTQTAKALPKPAPKAKHIEESDEDDIDWDNHTLSDSDGQRSARKILRTVGSVA